MNNEDNRRRRINELTEELAALSTELSQLILEENGAPAEVTVAEAAPAEVVAVEIDPQAVQAQQEREQRRRLEVDDRVVIVVRYGGLLGQEGTVVAVTRHQVSILLDNSRQIVNKRKTSVVRIS